MPEIIRNSPDKRFARLSNLHERHFFFKGIECHSIEGVLQAFKCPDQKKQEEMCLFSGKEAQRSGQEFGWSKDRLMHWQGQGHKRGTPEYSQIVTELFDATADAEDSTLLADLLATGHMELLHSIGKTYQYRTVLTINDFLVHMYRLRARAHREDEERTNEIVCRSLD
jgi:hypothetical protein